MTEDFTHLTPATAADIEGTLAHALQFDGRKAFRASGEMMAKITAAHLVEQLKISGFVIMKRPAAALHSYPPLAGPGGRKA